MGPALRALVGRTGWEETFPPAHRPHWSSCLTDIPELHARLLADVIGQGSAYSLVLADGYASVVAASSGTMPTLLRGW